jgi:hypothetical protein
MRLRMKLTVQGVGWQRMREKLQANLIGAREMARTRWLIGTSLPYASHWIEEGWRNDPRYGHVQVRYRAPATFFMRDAVDNAFNVQRRRAMSGPVGVVFSGTIMMQFALAIVNNMRQILNDRVYSAPVPTRNGRARWQRSHKLYNSIKAYRA